MSTDLQGRTAIVTGSTSGIGQGMALALAQAGANVVLNGLGDADKIEADRAEMAKQTGAEIRFHGADMTKPDEIADLIGYAEREFQAVDIVVNNAGVQTVSPIEDFPVDRWDLIIAINLSSAFHTTRLAFAQMKKRGWGRIINLASAHALVASPYKAAYVAAKHGIVGLTKTVGLEGGEYGITCNAICPGYVRTELVEKQIPDTAKARGITEEEVVRDVLLAPHATKEFVSIEQVGALAVFLCSDAASQITGAALPIDAGWSAH